MGATIDCIQQRASPSSRSRSRGGSADRRGLKPVALSPTPGNFHSSYLFATTDMNFIEKARLPRATTNSSDTDPTGVTDVPLTSLPRAKLYATFRRIHSYLVCTQILRLSGYESATETASERRRTERRRYAPFKHAVTFLLDCSYVVWFLTHKWTTYKQS